MYVYDYNSNTDVNDNDDHDNVHGNSIASFANRAMTCGIC